MKIISRSFLTASLVLIFGCNSNDNSTYSKEMSIERYRPAFHFTPNENWMNDPNGMVYYEGEYHLFLSIQSFWKHLGSYELGACCKYRSCEMGTPSISLSRRK